MDSTAEKKRVMVFDTTLRDGEQAPGYHLNPAQKLKLARQLHRLGVDVIEAGFPISSPADFEAVQSIAETVGCGQGAPEIAALARSVEADIVSAWNAIKEARKPRLHTFLATSDLHLERKFRIDRKEAIRRAVAGVRFAKTFTSNVQFSAEDASRSDRAFLVEVIESVIEAGATTVNIPDTVGYAIPTEFAELIHFLRENVRNIDRAVVSVHCHDDLGLAVANSVLAVQAGARQIEGTINGIGERAGNCSLEEAIMALHTRNDQFNVATGIRTTEIIPTSRMLAKLTGLEIAPNKAVVGRNAFAHASGIHQDGMLKDIQMYEVMRPEHVGSEGTTFPLTARSGRRALQARLQELGFSVSETHLGAVFIKFKEVADRCTLVGNKELIRLMR